MHLQEVPNQLVLTTRFYLHPGAYSHSQQTLTSFLLSCNLLSARPTQHPLQGALPLQLELDALQLELT